jgi:hypothetical protein
MNRSDRKALEKLAWQNTHNDYRSKWNGGDATLLHFVSGTGTCAIHLTAFTDNELLEKAGLVIGKKVMSLKGRGEGSIVGVSAYTGEVTVEFHQETADFKPHRATFRFEELKKELKKA